MGIGFVLLFVMVIGVSYAAYKFSAAGTKENVISTGIISMSYKQNSFIDLKNTYPKTDIYAIGTKGRDFLSRRGYQIKADYSDMVEEPAYTDAKAICNKVLDAFTSGEVGEIYLAYTSFKNTVVHEPKLIKLLPVDADSMKQDGEETDNTPMNYEPGEEEALNMIIPKYVCSLIYGAMVEAVASENGARMQAMDSATSNAEDMISDLSLKFNRARQASITQELTEIIAGANAIN